MSIAVLHRFVSSPSFTNLGERQFRGIAATDALCADGYALVIAGGRTDGLEALSWNHGEPIGRILRTQKTMHQLLFDAEFGPRDASEFIDETCSRLKAGVPYATSLQFEVLKRRPYPGKDGAWYATEWLAREIALCLVGVDPAAKVTERSRRVSTHRAVTGMPAALTACAAATEEHRSADRHHAAMAEALDRLDEDRRRVRSALRDFRRALEGGNAEEAAEAHAHVRRSLDGMARETRLLGDRHGDMTDSHGEMLRAWREAGAALGIQLDADADDDTSARSADRRHRQAEALRLAAPSLDDERAKRQRQAEALRLAMPPLSTICD